VSRNARVGNLERFAMSRSPEEGPADCLSIPSPALPDWKMPSGAPNLVVLKIVARDSGRKMLSVEQPIYEQFCPVTRDFLKSDAATRSIANNRFPNSWRSGGRQNEVAPTANDRGPFPVSVPKPLGAAIALGMAGWVTSVPASLRAIQPTDRRIVHFAEDRIHAIHT
jgi:hypothetical protein